MILLAEFIGWKQRGYGLADDLARAPSEHGFRALVPGSHDPVEVFSDDRVIGVRDNGGVIELAHVVALPLRNVRIQMDDETLSLYTAEKPLALEVESGPILALVGELPFPSATTSYDGFNIRHRRGTLSLEQLVRDRADRFLPAPTVEFLRGAVPEADAPVEAKDHRMRFFAQEQEFRRRHRISCSVFSRSA
jgi:hypothetical protein